MSDATEIELRLDRLDWMRIRAQLDERGYMVTPPVLTTRDCDALRASYGDDQLFRSTVAMSRWAYGQGEYRYFTYPLPKSVQTLRVGLYHHLVPLANEWLDRLPDSRPATSLKQFPEEHWDFIAECRAAGQRKPTPLLLSYSEGDYNALHRDTYGRVYFPFQAAIGLSDPTSDYEGGEFILLEDRLHPKGTVATAVTLPIGSALIFPTRERVPRDEPETESTVRHGASVIASGSRMVLGLILGDAR